MAAREGIEEVAIRHAQLKQLQAAFPTFRPLLETITLELDYGLPSPIQLDIAEFLETGPDYLMIQAQRGQAKTTITAAYAIFYLIHNPRGRVLIMSADGSGAGDISTLISRLIMSMDILECMRPDRTAGDRTSNEKFDIHYSLKGTDKSASVMALGITGTQQGKRADLLIADDIESTKNSMTATMRETILDRSKDFSSQVVSGRIVYLGTPQTQDSIYNTLPGRGFEVRIWPGRYPTPEQRARYGNLLAPIIADALDADPSLASGGGPQGDDGQPTDPSYITEEVLLQKEKDQGRSKFMLNHMLDTSLSDALRFPLKLEDIPLAFGTTAARLPLTVVRKVDGAGWTLNSGTQGFVMARGEFSADTDKAVGVVMYVDPAPGGANADETGYAVTAFLNGNIYVLAVGGIPGGYGVDKMNALAEIALEFKPNEIVIEKNMGYGAFREVWLPVLAKVYTDAAIKDDYVTGHKETRICNTLEPVIGRGSLVFTREALQRDEKDCERYTPANRTMYSIIHQIKRMTRDTGAVRHDDRIDALEGAVRYWMPLIAVDQDREVSERAAAELDAFMKDPFGHNRQLSGPSWTGGSNILSNRLRR